MQTIPVVVATVGSGLAGGVLFAFSTFVMAGLARLPDPAGIRAMQSINETAVQPPFMAALFGTAALCLWLVVDALRHWGDQANLLMLIGALLYLFGVVVVTAAFHVPLNNSLAGLDPDAAASAGPWRHYLRVWTLGNHVRAVAGLGAAALFAAALAR